MKIILYTYIIMLLSMPAYAELNNASKYVNKKYSEIILKEYKKTNHDMADFNNITHDLICRFEIIHSSEINDKEWLLRGTVAENSNRGLMHFAIDIIVSKNGDNYITEKLLMIPHTHFNGTAC